MVNITFTKEVEEIINFLAERSKTSKKERVIYNSIKYKVKKIKEDTHFGNPVAKRLIPEFYKEKYFIKNLFRTELANFWRLLYTVDNNKVEIIAIVIDIIDHKEYNKKFKYKDK